MRVAEIQCVLSSERSDDARGAALSLLVVNSFAVGATTSLVAFNRHHNHKERSTGISSSNL